jgi:myosin-1
MRPPGIFAVLDDVSKSVHSQSEGADKALGQRLPSCQNPHFDILGFLFYFRIYFDGLSHMRGNAFCVKHYAGDVTYEAAGMVEKNKDTLLSDHLQVLQLTDNELLLALFPDEVDPDSKKLPTTAGFKIRVRVSPPPLLVLKLTKLIRPAPTTWSTP